MQPVKPIMVTDLFPQERKQLLELFSEFEAEDWEKPTICPGWTVKDVGLQPIAVVTMDQETCWRLFTRGMSKNQARAKTTLKVIKHSVRNSWKPSQLLHEENANRPPCVLIAIAVIVGQGLSDAVWGACAVLRIYAIRCPTSSFVSLRMTILVRYQFTDHNDM